MDAKAMRRIGAMSGTPEHGYLGRLDLEFRCEVLDMMVPYTRASVLAWMIVRFKLSSIYFKLPK